MGLAIQIFESIALGFFWVFLRALMGNQQQQKELQRTFKG